MPDKKVIIIAGPNGAGKTTFAREYLPNEAECPIFVNADLIASGLSPFRPADAAIRAGRLMLGEINTHARAGRSFAFETTLAGRGYVSMIRQWRTDGYKVRLIFLSLATPEEAIRRVALRVQQGGHHIPEQVIHRRFDSGLRNFKTVYRLCVDDWLWYNNSGTHLSYWRRKTVIKEPPEKKPPNPDDADTEGVTAALTRAARRAHLTAHQTGTGVVVMQDGKVVEIEPDPDMYGELLKNTIRE